MTMHHLVHSNFFAPLATLCKLYIQWFSTFFLSGLFLHSYKANCTHRHSIKSCIYHLCRPSTEEAKQSTEEANVYPEDKKKAHKKRFKEVNNQKKKNFTTSFGPPFKKTNHPLAIMVRYNTFVASSGAYLECLCIIPTCVCRSSMNVWMC